MLAEWDYDTAHGGLGALAKATRWHDGEAYINQVHTINSLGLVSQASVTLPASLGPLAGQHWFTQGYFPNGQVGGQALPEIGELERGSIRRTYDHLGNDNRLLYQDRFGITVIVDQATYTPFGEIQTRLFGGSGAPRLGWHGFVYEEDTRRLERTTFDRQASIQSVADVRYTYDDAGNVLSIADVPAGLPANHELQCFQYDHNRRLVEAWAQGDTEQCAASASMSVPGGPAPYWHSYDHDSTGNRTAETLRTPGQTAVSRDYTYPQAGQPQPHALQQVTTTSGNGENITYAYDQAGNTTTRDVDGHIQMLHWDAEGRVETVDDSSGDTIDMVYDADGNRLIRDDGDQVTAYLPHTEVTWDRDNNTVTGTRYFTHHGQVVATCSGTDVADWTWMGVDHHGTTATHAVNAFTAVEQVRRLDPYGNPRGPAPHNWPGQQGFVGGVQDPTGLTHIGARSYDPLTGRFLSVDPILALGDGQQINGYAYAHNNPVTHTDPTGLFTSVNGVPCIDGDCSYHNPDGSVRTDPACRVDCGRGHGSSTGAKGAAAKPPAPPPPGPSDQVSLDSGIALDGELVLASSPDALQGALDAAEKAMCSWKIACSRDGLFVSQEYWEAYALNFICNLEQDWCDPEGYGTFIDHDGTERRYWARVNEIVIQQESGLGAAAMALLPQALRIGANSRQGTYIYLGIQDGKSIYVGITNNLTRRAAEHGKSGKGFDGLRSVTRAPVTRGEARAIEQALMARNPQFVNIRNSVSPSHPYYQRAVQWGEAWLRSSGW